MAKTVLKIAAIAGFVALTFIPGVGQALQGALVGALGGTFAALGVASTIVAITSVAFAIGALSALQGLMKPKVPAATLSRLSLSFDPNATRKTVFGVTAMGTDVVYQEVSGSDQEYVDYIIVCAAHRIDSFVEIRTEDNVLWNGSAVVGKYVGYATVDVRTEGTAANAIPINGGSTWTSNCRMTGCAYVHLRIKRTGNSKKAESPFASGLAGRMTIIGRGMPVYDPRRDSTRGGSGSQRANDQTTWAFTVSGVDNGGNTALQALAELIGWRIGGVVSVGAGMPLARIDFADFITAANICDEAVALAAGGTQRRYETAGMFGDENDSADVLSTLCGHMDAELRDVNGKIGIRIGVNDLSGGLPAFTADDVLGNYDYNGFATLTDTPNVVRGRYTDPSTASLYQLSPYSTVSVSSVDGFDRSETLDLALCQDAERAQRLATRLLLRLQYQSVLTVDLGPRAWALRPGSPLAMTFPPLGLVAQKFRLVSQSLKVVLDQSGAQQFCTVTMRADDPAIYAYTPGAIALPAAAIPAVNYNVLNNPLAITEGTDIGVSNGADVTAAALPSALATSGIPASTPVSGVTGATTFGDVATAAFSGGSGSTVGPIAIISGTSATAAILGPVNIDAQYLGTATGSGAVSITMAVQTRPLGGTFSTVSGGTDVQSGTVGDSLSGSLSVGSGLGAGVAGEARVVITPSSGDNITLSAPDSYWTAG